MRWVEVRCRCASLPLFSPSAATHLVQGGQAAREHGQRAPLKARRRGEAQPGACKQDAADETGGGAVGRS